MNQYNKPIQKKKENTQSPVLLHENSTGKNKGLYLGDNRAKSTIQLKTHVPVNDDKKLEHEADEMGKKAVQMKSAEGVAQLSTGSKKANEDMVRSMGAAAGLVKKLPNAKPHTTRGTGGGGGGTDHQARNAMVINKAKQDTRKELDDPTMFASSQMRMGNASHKQKEKGVEEARKEKNKGKKQSEMEEIREYYGYESVDQLTKDEIAAYREAMQ